MKSEKIRTAQFKNVPSRRAEIILRFDVPEEEASQNFMDALIGSIKQDLKKDLDAYNLEVEGNWP